MVAKCPADNTQTLEQNDFWDGHWDAHKIGWLISGAAAAVTCGIALITVIGHSRNYTRPLEQRQIIRVLLFAPVFSVVSFLSYRFFRSYTYYELAEVVYEAFAIAAFLMLLLQYIGDNVDEQKQVFIGKDKKPLPIPFCCLRYRPSKAYFLVLLKWSVVQYVIIRPALSIAGIITEYYEVLCESTLSYKYAYVYILAVDFVSISIALYGLIVLYALIRKDLEGRRPLAKFMTIKLGIFLIFYQGFVFDILADRGVIKATEYWTTTNISDGLNALCTSLEMVFIAGMQMWAFPWSEYKLETIGWDRVQGKINPKGKSSIFFSLMHALNFGDYMVELWHEIRFLFDRIRGKAYTRDDGRWGKFDIVQAFDVDDGRSDWRSRRSIRSIDSRMELREMESRIDESMGVARGQGGEGRFDGKYASGGDGRYLHPGSPTSLAAARPSSPRFANPHPAPASTVAASTPPASATAPALAPSPSLVSNGYASRQQGHKSMQSNIPENLSIGLSPSDLGRNQGGRLSPKPRSPRDSTGRYPAFIYNSGSADPSSPSNSSSSHTMGNGTADSQAQKGGAGGGYRVAGFPTVDEDAVPPRSPLHAAPTSPLPNPYQQQQQQQQQQQMPQAQQYLHPSNANAYSQAQGAQLHQDTDAEMTDDAHRVPLEPREDRPRSWEPQAF